MPNIQKILIVEDDPIANIIYRELFKRYECHFDIAESAELALEKFEHEDYDLLLVDIRLPKMHGFEFAKRIRATEKGRALPIVGISAITYSLVEDDFNNSGMDQYLGKPLSIADLDNLLQNHKIPLRITADNFVKCDIDYGKN